MKKRLKILMLFVMSEVPFFVYSQGDAFFYEKYEQRSENDLMGFDFGNFNNEENGFDFGNFSDKEHGFDFNGFNKDENGFSFGEFDYEDVTLGGGLLLLGGMAVLRLRRKNNVD